MAADDSYAEAYELLLLFRYFRSAGCGIGGTARGRGGACTRDARGKRGGADHATFNGEPGKFTRFRLIVLPARDTLSLVLWVWSFVTRRVQWRDDRYEVGRDGSAQLVVRL